MEKEDAETRSLRIVEIRALIQAKDDRVPMLVEKLRAKIEECQKIERERAGLLYCRAVSRSTLG